MEPKQLKIFDDDFVRFESVKKGKRTADVLRGYEDFVEKHKGKKTTDDCYTPPAVKKSLFGGVATEYKGGCREGGCREGGCREGGRHLRATQ